LKLFFQKQVHEIGLAAGVDKLVHAFPRHHEAVAHGLEARCFGDADNRVLQRIDNFVRSCHCRKKSIAYCVYPFLLEIGNQQLVGLFRQPARNRPYVAVEALPVFIGQFYQHRHGAGLRVVKQDGDFPLADSLFNFRKTQKLFHFPGVSVIGEKGDIAVAVAGEAVDNRNNKVAEAEGPVQHKCGDRKDSDQHRRAQLVLQDILRRYFELYHRCSSRKTSTGFVFMLRYRG